MATCHCGAKEAATQQERRPPDPRLRVARITISGLVTDCQCVAALCESAGSPADSSLWNATDEVNNSSALLRTGLKLQGKDISLVQNQLQADGFSRNRLQRIRRLPGQSVIDEITGQQFAIVP